MRVEAFCCLITQNITRKCPWKKFDHSKCNSVWNCFIFGITWKEKKNFMTPFYGWGSTASTIEPLWGDRLLFTAKFPEIPGTHFIDLRKDERLPWMKSLPWSRPVVLNIRPLDWKSRYLSNENLLNPFENHKLCFLLIPC